MIAFPNAKINIGLNILGKRSDGFHNLYSCFYPVPWCDVLEIIESKRTSFSASGIKIPGDDNENLCLRAYELLASDFELPPVNIYLHKVIPIGAGLGGGSSDAAFMLKLLNDKFELGISLENLEQYAGQLGSDCPFFIRNMPGIASETGKILQSHEMDLSEFNIVLVNPGIHISTAEAYANVSFSTQPSGADDLFNKKEISNWKDVLINDFESHLFILYPQLLAIKKSLYQLGALYASMSGSGSTVYGIFNNTIDTSTLENMKYTVFQNQLMIF